MGIFALTRLPWLRRWFGNRAERAVERFLRRLGYRILHRNYSCRIGELDLVARDGDCIVFVEVRSTGRADDEFPALSVNREKQRRLSHLAEHYLQRYRLVDTAARFDVVTVAWPDDAKEPAISHYLNAFESLGW